MGERSYTTMWEFKTANFTVRAGIMNDYDLDLSWDDDGEVMDKLQSGVYQAFQTKVSVLLNDTEIGADFLGGSIYEQPRDFFREHLGCRPKGYGAYFSDMVREAISEARHTLPKIALKALREVAHAA